MVHKDHITMSFGHISALTNFVNSSSYANNIILLYNANSCSFFNALCRSYNMKANLFISS